MSHPSIPSGLSLALILSLLVVFAPAQYAAAASRKLSDITAASGSVTELRITPDGSYAVYLADYDTARLSDLYSVPLAGGPPVKLNGPLPATGGVEWFEIAPDGSRVVYAIPQATPNKSDLYSVPLTGGAPVQLNGSLGVPSSVRLIAPSLITSDSSHVVFAAVQATQHTSDLYSVPINGGAAAVKLNDPLAEWGAIGQYAIAPDSSQVVYVPSDGAPWSQGLYSVPLAGGTPVLLSASSLDRNIGIVGILPDSSRIIYSYGGGLYSVPLAGGPRVALVDPLVAGVVWFRQLAPDGGRVVYTTAEPGDTSKQSVYSVPVDGGAAAVKLNSSLTWLGSGDAQITPDSGRVVYAALQESDGQYYLYSAPIDGGGEAVKLCDPPPEASIRLSIRIAPDSSRVIYTTYKQSINETDIYSVPMMGGASVKLNSSLARWTTVPTMTISPDSSRVLYVAQGSGSDRNELYSAPIAGGAAPVKLNGPLASGAIFLYRAVADKVIYAGAEVTAGSEDLRLVPLSGGASSLLDRPHAIAGSVQSYQISPDGRYTVYTANQEHYDRLDLYSVPLRGGSPVKLNGSLTGLNGSYVQIAPDSSRVIYRAYEEDKGTLGLFSVPIGGGAIVRLEGTLPSMVLPHWFQVTPDSSRVIYLAFRDNPDKYELYSAPLAGGPPVKLNGPLQGWYVYSPQITPDGSRVIYTAQQDRVYDADLYSAPIGGETAAVKLNDDLFEPFQGVDLPRSTPDGSRVVYQVSGPGGFVHYYSVPLRGGTPVQLDGPLPSGEILSGFEISPDSRRVLYRAHRENADTYALYSVPIGGGAAVQLAGNIVVTGSPLTLSQYLVAPDSSRVVYLASLGATPLPTYALYSVPMSGGAATAFDTFVQGPHSGPDTPSWLAISPDSSRLVYERSHNIYSAPLAGGARVKLNSDLHYGTWSYFTPQITPDSSRVIYGAWQDSSALSELYSAPIAGGGAPVKLNGPLTYGGAVTNFQITPDSRWVIYSAPQQPSQQQELYAAFLTGGPVLKLSDTLTIGGAVSDWLYVPLGHLVVYRASQDVRNVTDLYVADLLTRKTFLPVVDQPRRCCAASASRTPPTGPSTWD